MGYQKLSVFKKKYDLSDSDIKLIEEEFLARHPRETRHYRSNPVTGEPILVSIFYVFADLYASEVIKFKKGERVTIKKYKSKPVIKYAIQLTVTNIDDIEAFVGGDLGKNKDGNTVIVTLKGAMEVCLGDYVVRGIKGEFYAVKPDIFEMSYEEII